MSRIFLFFLSIFVFLSLHLSPALAATPINNDPENSRPASIQDLETIFTNVTQAIVAFGGIALLFVLIRGGLSWTMAQGDPKKLQQAQYTISYGVIGFILLISIVLILKLVEQFTGVQVTIFRIVLP